MNVYHKQFSDAIDSALNKTDTHGALERQTMRCTEAVCVCVWGGVGNEVEWGWEDKGWADQGEVEERKEKTMVLMAEMGLVSW